MDRKQHRFVGDIPRAAAQAFSGGAIGEGFAATSPEPMASVSVPPIGVDRYDLRVVQSLRQIMRAVDIHSRKLAKEYRITAPQLICLLAITDGGPLTATAIAKRIYLSPSTVIGILDRLQQKGLVQRERDTEDRRLVHVSATKEGSKLAENAPSPLQDTFADALKGLPELEQVAIALSLERVVSLMEVQGVGAAPILQTGSMNQEAQNVSSKAGQPMEPGVRLTQE